MQNQHTQIQRAKRPEMVKNTVGTYLKTALSLYKSGRYKESRKLLSEILKVNPKHLESLLISGQSFMAEGRHEEALEEFTKGLTVRPNGLNFLLLTAQTYTRLSQYDKAEILLSEAIDRVGNPQLSVNLAVVKSQLSKPREALEIFESLGVKNLANEKALFHCAKCFVEVGKLNNGITTYLACLKQNPQHRASLNNLANVYQKTANYPEAIRHYEALINHYPKEGMGFNNLAGLYEKQNDLDKSVQLYKQAVTVEPSLSIAYYNLARLFATRMSDHERALEVCARGLEKSEGSYKVGLRYQQIISRQFLNDWSSYGSDQSDLPAILKRYVEEVSPLIEIVPFELSFSNIEGSLYRRVAEKYADGIARNAKQRFPNLKYDHTLGEGKISIGYYSPKFRKHPGGYLVRKLFDHHDSAKFEIHAFSLVHTDDFVNKDVQNSVDYYHDVSTLSSDEIANLINRTGIDILVSLAGYNVFMNMEVLALRPAPIQMMMLGSQETTGASFIDYVFSDESMMDKSLRKNLTEQVITLPVSTLVNSELPDASVTETERADHGLAEDKFVFASFNHPKKIDPEVFDAWCQILKRVPESVLWVYDAGLERIRKNILQNAQERSILPDRIVFAKPVPEEQHWERLRHADLFLDTFNCNAHFTAVEILRSNKLILTLRGATHNSRLCASILHYAHLDDLVANSPEEYVDQAVLYAKNPEMLHEMEKELAHGESLPLFDTELQVRFLEKAFRTALSHYNKTGQYKDLIVKSLLKFDSFD